LGTAVASVVGNTVDLAVHGHLGLGNGSVTLSESVNLGGGCGGRSAPPGQPLTTQPLGGVRETKSVSRPLSEHLIRLRGKNTAQERSVVEWR
jgi:hypothetical protein